MSNKDFAIRNQIYGALVRDCHCLDIRNDAFKPDCSTFWNMSIAVRDDKLKKNNCKCKPRVVFLPLLFYWYMLF